MRQKDEKRHKDKEETEWHKDKIRGKTEWQETEWHKDKVIKRQSNKRDRMHKKKTIWNKKSKVIKKTGYKQRWVTNKLKRIEN